MAKPIEATPTLKGKDAERFIRTMIREDKRKPTKRDMEIFRKIMFMPDGRTPRCHYCGRAMRNYTPTSGKFKGKLQEHSWVCDCAKFKSAGIVMSVG